MGLLATVASATRRFGLLPRVVARLPLVSLICVICGIAWLAVLPMDGQFRSTYFSENALLPHQAITFFRETEWDIVRGIKGQIVEYNSASEHERNAGVQRMFEDYGWVSHTHEWHYANGTYGGENVYAMLKAARGPHNEAIVVAAPWIGMDGKLNEGGTALLLALARFFKRWNFWHKNLIFAMPSNAEVALRKWVEAYHTSLQYTAGSIEGAVVLDYEFANERFDHLEVCYAGLNGQLPNLDLVNTIVYSTAAEFFTAELLGGNERHRPNSYQERAETLGRQVVQQSLGGLLPACGSDMFSGWRIDAVTIKAIEGENRDDITTFGRVCESTVRSINNLLEHFHQSFFFYFMLGPQSFVSIASYLPSAMLVANSFGVMALYLLFSMSMDSSTAEASASSGEAKEGKGEKKLGGKSNGNGDVATSLPKAALAQAATVFVSALSGWAWLSLPTSAIAIAASVTVMATVVLVSRLSVPTKQVLLAFCLALLGLELTALGMLNFSLALALGVACVPIAWIRPGEKPFRNTLLATLSCPLPALLGLSHFLGISLSELMDRFVLSHNDLSVWTPMLTASVWLPAWLVAVAATI